MMENIHIAILDYCNNQVILRSLTGCLTETEIEDILSKEYGLGNIEYMITTDRLEVTII